MDRTTAKQLFVPYRVPVYETQKKNAKAWIPVIKPLSRVGNEVVFIEVPACYFATSWTIMEVKLFTRYVMDVCIKNISRTAREIRPFSLISTSCRLFLIDFYVV